MHNRPAMLGGSVFVYLQAVLWYNREKEPRRAAYEQM